jgi:hypothetical protein
MSAKFVVGESPDSEFEEQAKNGVTLEDDNELTVFGNFDPDDPDFMSPTGGRSRSRLSGSRNSSSSSLRRIASNNSIGRQLSGMMNT